MTLDDLPLFAEPPEVNLPPHADKLQKGWLLCKEKHPQLLNTCYQLCLTAKRRGFERWSADAMFHVLRWETALTTGDLALKVNNSYSALAARDLMAMHPDLEGFFELRVRKARGNFGHVS
jgi:hypothetical protein